MVRRHRDPAGTAKKIAREYALRLLGKVDRAVERLRDREDQEALHDTRLALRRLRAWLRAFDTVLHLKPKQLRRLQRLAHSTNGARDAETSLVWLDRLRPSLEARFAAGTGGISRSLAALRDEQYRQVRRELPVSWTRLSVQLRHSFSRRKLRDGETLFMGAYCDSLDRYAIELEAALIDARRNPDALRIHRLRIATKKVRYLLEIVLPRHRQVMPLVKRLIALLDSAGQIQDLQRFIELSKEVHLRQAASRYGQLLASYVGTADAADLPQPDAYRTLVPLLAACRAAAQRQVRCMTEFRRRYLKPKRPQPVRQLQRLLPRLRDSSYPPR